MENMMHMQFFKKCSISPGSDTFRRCSHVSIQKEKSMKQWQCGIIYSSSYCDDKSKEKVLFWALFWGAVTA